MSNFGKKASKKKKQNEKTIIGLNFSELHMVFANKFDESVKVFNCMTATSSRMMRKGTF